MFKMPCLDCGTPTQGSRCINCFDINKVSKPKRIRATPTQRGYDSEWRKMRLKILNRDKWICYYCNKKLFGSDATVDHIQSLANGGARLDPFNLVSACRSCNSSKQ